MPFLNFFLLLILFLFIPLCRYNEDGTIICTFRSVSLMVPQSSDGANSRLGWQSKAVNVSKDEKRGRGTNLYVLHRGR